ncbi:MAG: right-handed parallel beta-helix repeat-containing protein [Pseudomonadota bacterium]
MNIPRTFSAVICAAMVLPLQAATFAPTRTDDPAPDGCLAGDCSLREAIIAANEADGADVVELAPGQLYLLQLDGVNSSPTTGDLDITSEITLRGQGAILDGQSTGRILDVRANAAVTIENLTLRNANTSLATNGALNGGAMQVEDTVLTLRDVIFQGNATQTLGGGLYVRQDSSVTIEDSAFVNNQGSNGGAIHSSSPLTLRNVLFQSNTAEQSGAAAYLVGTETNYQMEEVSFISNTSSGNGGAMLFLGRNITLDGVLASGNGTPADNGGFLGATATAHLKTITLRNAVVNGNDARDGGAVYVTDAEDQLTIEHASFADNSGTRDGGALHVRGGEVRVTNATFAGNEAADDGGAIYVSSGTVTLQHLTVSEGSGDGTALAVIGSTGAANVTLANNLLSGDCSVTVAVTVTSAGGNLEGPGDTCILTSASDLTGLSGSDLGLLPLTGSPGPTETYPLTSQSLARDQGEAAICGAVNVDQLFEPRDSACDSGAREAEGLFSDSFEVIRSLGSNVTVAL